MALYSDKVMDHFRNPRNVGVIENADGVGEVGNAKCGDIMKIYLKIDNDIITDVKFVYYKLTYFFLNCHFFIPFQIKNILF